jgi:putative oxidoreductase
MNRLLSTKPFFGDDGLLLVRVITGYFLIYHASEVFDRNKMNEYIAWDIFKNTSSAAFMEYMGKTAELVTGFLLALGLLTRIASLIIIGTFVYIAFFIGGGKIWYEDQHPFLFAIFGCMFFFSGPEKWSLDYGLFNKKSNIKTFQKIVNMKELDFKMDRYFPGKSMIVPVSSKL